MTGLTGTLRYMAPEVMITEEYNEKVDIYSFALVVWFMCTGIRPLGDVMVTAPSESVRVESCPLPSRIAESKFHGEKLATALLAGCRPPLDQITLPGMAALLSQSWTASPGERPAAEELIRELEALRPALLQKRPPAILKCPRSVCCALV
eukprot:CAMPEP_0172178234 /NCGR_PEP_ID=MMETSP1050-20130122/15906_1 /TAXON_ID=233186 /ORGANISM="Cryptomonas curvata, Strain CCAP979/52" /LENGTH=149 /DNA_ID=CAMNT_0012850897 /DNA_START=318 /DNA_END=767 /DNA_ORIENTATION=-